MTWGAEVDPAWTVGGERDGRRSWLRAAPYFVACLVIAAAGGALTRSPLRTHHLSELSWWAATTAVIVVEFVAYWIVWPRGTFTLDRPRSPYSLLFGLVWGICQGLLFATAALHLRAWVAWLVLAAFQGCFHGLWWDRTVAPPHNVPAWNLRKVLLCHTPNLVAALWWWSVWRDVGPFVLFQVVALVGSARAMRFPSPIARRGIGQRAAKQAA